MSKAKYFVCCYGNHYHSSPFESLTYSINVSLPIVTTRTRQLLEGTATIYWSAWQESLGETSSHTPTFPSTVKIQWHTGTSSYIICHVIMHSSSTFIIYKFVHLTLILQACSINLLAFSSALYLFGSWTLKNFKAPSKSACRRSSFEVCKIITQNRHHVLACIHEKHTEKRISSFHDAFLQLISRLVLKNLRKKSLTSLL